MIELVLAAGTVKRAFLESDIMKADKGTSLPKGRNGAIDFLRFAASVILVLHHYQQVNNVFIDNGVNFYSGHFYWGFLVDLFFMISGFFLISSSDRITDGTLKFKDYYLHKCVRLLPLVSLAGVIYFFVNNFLYYNVMGGYYIARSTGTELVLTFLGMQVGWANLEGSDLNPPMWYISALLIAFVVLYLLISLSRKTKFNYAYALTGLIILSVLGDFFGLELPFFQTDARRAYIDVSLGLLLASFLKKHKIKGFHYIFVSLAGIAGAALYLLALSDERFLLERYALSFLFFPAIMILCTSPAAKKIFSGKAWSVLGAASFDTYVLHVICLLLLRCANKSWNLGLSFENWWLEYLTCLLIFGIGLLSYRFVEPNLKKLAEKFVNLF